jgi:uncharacterized protein (UPF0333 family)
MKVKIDKRFLLLIPAILLVSSLILPPVGYSAITSTQATTSNVTVNTYVSISLTAPLAGGVQFGSLDPGTNDNPSTTCTGVNCNITVSSDTNVNVDIVLKANAALTRQGGTETIPNTGYTWNSTDASYAPPGPGIYALSTSYDYTNKVGANVAPGGKRAWQAWLDIPGGQTAGTYNNTLSFCADQAGTTNC